MTALIHHVSSGQFASSRVFAKSQTVFAFIAILMLSETSLTADDAPPRKKDSNRTGALTVEMPTRNSTADSAKVPAASTALAPSKSAASKTSPSNAQKNKVGWGKASGRGWTAAMQSSEASRIDFITANRPDSVESKNSTESATQESLQDSEETSPAADDSALQVQKKLAEQFRKALENRRLERGEVAETPVESSQSETTASNTPNASPLSGLDLLGLSPQDARDLEGDDPVKREKAQRFVRLRLQLLELKKTLRAANTNPPSSAESATELSTATPSSTDPTLDGHTIDHEPLSPSAGDHATEQSTEPDQIPADPQTSHGEAHTPSEHIDAHSESHSAAHHSPVADDHQSDPTNSSIHSEHPSPHDRRAADSHDAHTPEPPTAEHQTPAARPLSQTPIVDGAIDRLGLANNLYAIGDYLVAREMYEHTDMAELTAQQQIWAEYQIANCLRRMGQKAEASNRYRRIAAQPEAGWLSEQSAWWVDVLEQTRQLEKALQEETTVSPKPAPKSKEPKNGKPSR